MASGVGEQLLVDKRVQSFDQPLVFRFCCLGNPASAEVFHGSRIQIGDVQDGTDIGGEVVPAFGKDFPQAVFRHLDQTVFLPHPIATVVFDRDTERSWRHREHQYPAVRGTVGMVDFLEVDGQRNPLAESLSSSFRLLERFCADDLARASVRHSKNDPPAALVGQSTAVFAEFLEVKAASGGFELKVLTFLVPHPFFEQGDSGAVSHQPASSPLSARFSCSCASKRYCTGSRMASSAFFGSPLAPAVLRPLVIASQQIRDGPDERYFFLEVVHLESFGIVQPATKPQESGCHR